MSMPRNPHLLVCLAVLGLAGRASAQGAPLILSESGTLLDTTGGLITGDQSFTFTIYPAATGGAPLWSETQTIAVSGGYFAAELGLSVDLPPIFSGAPLYLGIQVGTDAEMTPRQPITSVPYALSAATALTAVNAIGDITPTSVSIGGQVIIDKTGSWVGPTTGFAGPAGPTGPMGASGVPGDSVSGTPDISFCANGGVDYTLNGTTTPVCNGAPGGAGAQGPAGPTGSQGPAGPTGSQGPAGPTGSAGSSLFYFVGSNGGATFQGGIGGDDVCFMVSGASTPIPTDDGFNAYSTTQSIYSALVPAGTTCSQVTADATVFPPLTGGDGWCFDVMHLAGADGFGPDAGGTFYLDNVCNFANPGPGSCSGTVNLAHPIQATDQIAVCYNSCYYAGPKATQASWSIRCTAP